MRVIRKGEKGYDTARRIGNSRFDLRPAVLCFCSSAADVTEALAMARAEGLGVRIRSGGHHHEGMCSGDGVLVIDLSGMHRVDLESDPAVVGPGATLGAIYDEADAQERLFPGGGCRDVRVGGLVQGGGWGPYSRHLGLTCDRLVGFRMVTAEGAVLDVTEESDPELLRAVRGGGGGNFGVVTELRFDLPRRPKAVTSFTMTWGDVGLVAAVADEWRRNFPDDTIDRLTTFCRLTAIGSRGESEDHPVVLGGAFLGEPDELKTLLLRLLPKTFEHGDLRVDVSRSAFTSMYQPGPPIAALRRSLPGVAEEDLVNTCLGVPHRHKVSSSFPDPGFGDEAMEAMVAFVSKAPPTTEGRFYLSLHCLGGDVARRDPSSSSFAFRDRPFLLQYQAWWVADPALDADCIRWVRDFREKMVPYTGFAFINFPDRDLAQDRKKLARQYYAHKLGGLISVKRRLDPEDVFAFGMGIPTS
jgi:hypothetical protein